MKKKKLYPAVRQNGGSGNKRPVPPDVYQYVKDRMWFLTMDELKKQLQVSKRVAKALRNGAPISLPHERLMILKSNIGLYRRYCLGSRIKWEIEESRDAQLFVELNRFLAKVIAEMPEDLAKLTRGGWLTRHLHMLRPMSIWSNQVLIIQLLAELKKWYTVVHERWPEFDRVLFAGTGLFDDKSGTGLNSSSSGLASTHDHGAKKKTRHSRKSHCSMNHLAMFLIRTGIFQLPSRGAPPRCRGI